MNRWKCRHKFSAISQSEITLKAKVTRNYFETSHGKGPCDGLGGINKRKVSNAVVQDNDLSVTNAAEFCKTNLKTVGDASKSRAHRYAASSRSFCCMEQIERLNTTSAKTRVSKTP
jgi:hypothetical protein